MFVFVLFAFFFRERVVFLVLHKYALILCMKKKIHTKIGITSLWTWEMGKCFWGRLIAVAARVVFSPEGCSL